MSRTLGFIAGLTVPAGLYYISVVHLQGTTNVIRDALHEQSLRLDDPTKIDPLVVDPREHSTLPARIRQGWNDGIENGVRFAQETDWEKAANQASSAIANLTRAGWDKSQPAVEAGKQKIHELSEASRDAALRAGETVGSTIHDGGIKARELTHDASVKGHELAHDINAETHRLARVASEDAVEAKQYLKEAEKRAEAEYGRLKVEAGRKSHEVKVETARQAQEATSVLSAAKSTIADKIAEIKRSASRAFQDTKETTIEGVQTVEKKAESSLRVAQNKASETWILTEDRYHKLLESSRQSTDMKFKELHEKFGNKRIGFSRVDDPTDATKHVQASERQRQIPVPVVKNGAYDFYNADDVPAVLQNTS